MLANIKKAGKATVFIEPFVTEEVVYLSADAEDKFIIAQANTIIE